MRHRRHVHLGLLSLVVGGLAVAGAVTASTPHHAVGAVPVAGSLPAFPGAEGYGTGTPGGRGGQVCPVTNLDDAGPGSLRACVEASGPRIVVFRIGGTIDLQSRLTVSDPFLTIAGQTAPGDGITLRMDPESSTDKGTMQVETHDVVIRYVRFRPGDNGHGDDSHDALQLYKAGVYNVVVDHASFSWAIDENVNSYDETHDITVSNSIISEALSNSTHPLGEHSKGMLAGGVNAHNVSIHHNLFASNVDRNPQISGVAVADIRNNVIYNYGDGSGQGVTLVSSSNGEPDVNWIANYYKPGPDSDPARAEFATYNGTTGATHEWYGEGNLRWTPTGDQAARVASAAVGQRTTPFDAPPVTTTTAAQAYTDVLAHAGASLVRDAVDERIVTEVENGTGSVKDSAAGLYPSLDPGTPPVDSDGDAMPDTFEVAHGSDPASPDADGDVDGDGYSNVEDWFNGLVDDSGGGPGPEPEPPAAEISFVGSSNAYESKGIVTVPLPPGVVVGDDVLLHVVENKGTGGAITAPAAVTPLGPEVNDGSSLGSRTYLYEVPATPPSGLTFSGKFTQMSATATAYRSVGSAAEVAHVVETGRDSTHPVVAATTPGGWHVLLGSDRIDERRARRSTWTVDARLTERQEAGGTNGDRSALSQVVGDTGVAVPSGGAGYSASASQVSPYAVTALVTLVGQAG